MTKHYRLKEHHKTFQKVQALWNMADELGITLSFAAGRCMVEDNEKPGITFFLEDIEDNSHVSSFPHPTEFKIVYRTDDGT